MAGWLAERAWRAGGRAIAYRTIAQLHNQLAWAGSWRRRLALVDSGRPGGPTITTKGRFVLAAAAKQFGGGGGGDGGAGSRLRLAAERTHHSSWRPTRERPKCEMGGGEFARVMT